MAKQNPGGDAGQEDARQRARATQANGTLAGEPRRRRPPGAASRPWQRRVAAWLPRALSLPGQVGWQTFLVFCALARTLFTKSPPPRGRLRELPVGYGDGTPLGETRRVLLTGAMSLAPNEFVLGIDEKRDVMITHQLVAKR